jgi:PKD repeat protein
MMRLQMCYPRKEMKNKTVGGILFLLMGLLAGGCVGPDLLPVATFTLAPGTGLSPLIVTFDASESISPNGVISQYSWDFGDGTKGSGMIVVHSYQTDEDQTFTVTLSIVNHEGKTASSTGSVDVRAPIPPATEAPSIEFVWPFHFDAEGDDATNLNDEYFTLQNTGAESIDLSGWRVENDHGVAFRLPGGVTLAPGAQITIYSGSGTNTTTRLYLSASEPVWNNDYDLAFLLDAAGEIVTYYVITSC